MGKETFILRSEWSEDIELMNMEERGELLTLLFEYATDGRGFECSRVASIVFQVWRRFIDACDEKYEEVRKERSKAGKASAEARKKKKEQEQSNLTSVDFVETETNKTNLSDSVSVSVPVSDSVIENIPQPTYGGLCDIQRAHDTNNPDLARVIQYYQRKVSPDMSRDTTEQIIFAVNEWNADVVISAIDAAIDNGKRNGSYICAILRQYRKDGIRTIEDVRRKEEQFRADREREQNQRQIKLARNTPAGSAGYLPQDDLAYLFENPPETPQEAI